MRNRWLIAVMGTVLMLCLGTVYAWSYFQALLVAKDAGFGWTNSQAAWIFALAIFFLGVSAAVAGPRLQNHVVKLAHAEKAKLVVCGHSHVPFVGEDRGLTIFNPGSCGPRRFALPIVFGTISIAAGKLRFGHLEAATGNAWTP